MKKFILKPVLTLAFLMLFVAKSNAQMTPCTTPPDPPCVPACMEVTVDNQLPCDLDFYWGYGGCTYISGAKKILASNAGCTPQNCSTDPSTCGTGTNPPCCCSNDPVTCGTPGNLPCCTPTSTATLPNNTCVMYGPCAKCPGDNSVCECPNKIFIATATTPQFYPWGDFPTILANGNSTYIILNPQNFCPGCTGAGIRIIVTIPTGSTNKVNMRFECF